VGGAIPVTIIETNINDFIRVFGIYARKW